MSADPGVLYAHMITGMGRGPDSWIDIDWISAGAQQSEFATTRIQLNGYTSTPLDIVALGTGTQTFNSFSINVLQLILPGNTIVPGPHTKTVPSNFKLMAGRTTAIQTFFDESMVFEDQGAMIFDDVAFDFVNVDLFGGSIPAFFSDCVRVDIGQLSSRPGLNAGGQAQFVYVSGDVVGLSGSSSTTFEIHMDRDRNLDFVPVRGGTFIGTTAGTYTVVEPNPQNSSVEIPRYTAPWTDIDNVVQDFTEFVMISFPSTDSTKSDHLLMLSRSSGVITACYFGTLNRNTGSFSAYPIGQFKQSSPTTIGGVASIEATGGNYSIESGTPPATFPLTGTYLRFVR
ncbi:MAG: hypothetical protein DCC46_09295 [Armatimonadetes bacterium]|nr:MAG: hypothetical protein DCC46_09295 [Armatimonadota bacterium]